MGDKQRTMTLVIRNVLLPLLIGTAVYVLWNPNTYIGIFVSRLLGVRSCCLSENLWNNQLSMWIKYYAADMAWAYAFAYSLCLVTGTDRRARIACLSACVLLEIFLELAQYIHVISGYFDWMDIVVELVMNFCAYCLWKCDVKRTLEGGKRNR